MKKPKVDYTGQRFRYLTAVRYIPPNERSGYSRDKDTRNWLCKCDCGKYVRVRSDQLKDCRVQSCGCMSRILSGEKHKKHGMKRTRLYRIWNDMKDRCGNKNAKDYPRYGERGITVCDEWRDDFRLFYAWSMGNGYQDELSIDRIDNNKGYSPENCRWVSGKVQCRNKSNNVLIEYQGERKTIAEWCELLGVNRALAYHRHSAGWASEKIFETPVRKQRNNRKED